MNKGLSKKKPVASAKKKTSQRRVSLAQPNKKKEKNFFKKGKAEKKKGKKKTTSRKGNTGNLLSLFTSQWGLTILVSLLLLCLFGYFVLAPHLSHNTESDGVYGVDIPEGFHISGVDISHHQGDIDWDKFKETLHNAETPLTFVFVKATEGGDLKDERFDDNFAQAEQAGFVRGAYHFYIPTTDPVAQADFFIRNVQLKPGDLPPVVDIEVKPQHNKEAVFYAQLSTFLYRLEAHYGVKPIIYSYYKYKERYLKNPELDRYPFWIAHYHVKQLKYSGPWAFWQHSDKGVIPGIPEKTDLNVFNGTLHDLNKITLK